MMKPNTGRALSAAGAILLLVSLALVWYHVDRPTGTTNSTGWDTFPRLRIVLLVGALLTLATAAVRQVRWVLVARTALGVIVAALILRRIIDPPDISSPVRPAIGVYVGFVAALAVAVGGLVDTGRRVVAAGGLGFGRPIAELPPPTSGGRATPSDHPQDEPSNGAAVPIPNLAPKR
jgi:peptidoglycan/LPS O-acetylase OafA/YrhL